MALIDPTKRIRLDIPHEPGQWIEIRPITVRVVNDMPSGEGVNYGAEIARRTITGWSYEQAFTPEAVDDLDFTTFNWLIGAINQASGIRGDDEKKDSEPASPSGPPPTTPTNVTARSPRSSGS